MEKVAEKKVRDRVIQIDADLLSALKQMDAIDKKLLIVFDGDDFVNVLSIGDIQRAILGDIKLNEPLGKALRTKNIIASATDSLDQIKQVMRRGRIECMPVISQEGALLTVHFWEDLFGEEETRTKANLSMPVVIMAGGKGTRLKPLTNVIPKPLLPIGDKTIIEEIMERFSAVGCSEFHLSVNYKAETIKHYFAQLEGPKWNISYFQEDEPLGTAGSLFLAKEKLKSTFFVSNCDIIINEDYAEIVNYHKQNKNELTIVSALKDYSIPYGTIETTSNGTLASLREKPDLLFQINTGMYVLEPHLLDEIPENKFFHITHLIEKIMARGGRVGVFPISEGSWIDIGEWDSYLSLCSK